MKRIVLMIDGGHLRALARRDKVTYNPDLIERFSLGCVDGDEELLRFYTMIVLRTLAKRSYPCLAH